MLLGGYRHGLFADGDHAWGGGGELRTRSADAYIPYTYIAQEPTVYVVGSLRVFSAMQNRIGKIMC